MLLCKDLKKKKVQLKFYFKHLFNFKQFKMKNKSCLINLIFNAIKLNRYLNCSNLRIAFKFLIKSNNSHVKNQWNNV